MKRRKQVLSMLLGAAMVLSAMVSVPPKEVKAEGTNPWNNIAAYQVKDVFATDTAKVSGLTVKDTSGNAVTKAIEFTIYNSTKQEVQEVVNSSNGVLPDLNLVKDHNYIFFVNDTEYKMKSVYVWVQNDGTLLDIKSRNAEPYDYTEVTGFSLMVKAAQEDNDTFGRNASFTRTVFKPDGVTPMANCHFKLVSEYGTVDMTTGRDGRLVNVPVLEDVNYMVIVENDTYGIETFPITMKDKSEYSSTTGAVAGRYTYDHSSCKRVDEITLVNKGSEHANDTVLTSSSGKTTVTGLNFKDILLDERTMNKEITQLAGKNYDVINIKAINPHRYEVAKLAAGNFTITEKVSGTKQAAQVYYIDKDGTLQKVNFQQVGDKVVFTMNTLSLYPVVIEYGNEDIATGNQLLNVKVVDGNNNPVSGVQLCLKPAGADAVNFATVTNAAGQAAYQCSGNETAGSAYELSVAAGGSYTCASPKSVVFGSGNVASVDGVTYTGNEITLTVTTGGGDEPDPGPVADNRTLRVKVVDEAGNPVEGVSLELRWEGFTGFGSLTFSSVTDAAGMSSYVCRSSNDEIPGDYYELHPTEDSGYTCEEPITVILGEDADGTFVESVGEDEVEYTGEVLTLVVSAL